MNKLIKSKPDFLLFFLTLLLVGFGILMVFSSSSMTSITEFHSAWYFVERQALWTLIGFFTMIFMMKVPFTKFKTLYFPIFIVTLVLLILVLLFGTKINGHKSWFGIGSVGIQPTEFAKLALILYLSALITKKGEQFHDFKKGLLPVILIIGSVASLILLQPDIGSDIIIISASFMIVIAGGANLLYLGLLILCCSPIAMYILVAKSYRLQRFTSFLNPWNDTQGSSYQLIQSLYALGHGGITGVGFGKGIQKIYYLPEAHTDFIFSTIGEELGLIGSLLFIILYVLFLWRGLIIAVRCPDPFGTLVGVGIISSFAAQALINLGGVTGSLPITGVPLPLISYGGSSLLISMVSIGILLSISRQRIKPE